MSIESQHTIVALAADVAGAMQQGVDLAAERYRLSLELARLQAEQRSLLLAFNTSTARAWQDGAITGRNEDERKRNALLFEITQLPEQLASLERIEQQERELRARIEYLGYVLSYAKRNVDLHLAVVRGVQE